MVSIALPVIGRDLDIPEYRLQWLVSAYALSSVSSLWTSIHRRTYKSTLCNIGMFPGVLWSFSGPVWPQKGVHSRLPVHDHVLSWTQLRKWYVSTYIWCWFRISFFSDEITLDVLRGFQGIGAAATIPSSVSLISLCHLSCPSDIS